MCKMYVVIFQIKQAHSVSRHTASDDDDDIPLVSFTKYLKD